MEIRAAGAPATPQSYAGRLHISAARIIQYQLLVEFLSLLFPVQEFLVDLCCFEHGIIPEYVLSVLLVDLLQVFQCFVVFPVLLRDLCMEEQDIIFQRMFGEGWDMLSRITEASLSLFWKSRRSA